MMRKSTVCQLLAEVMIEHGGNAKLQLPMGKVIDVRLDVVRAASGSEPRFEATAVCRVPMSELHSLVIDWG